MNETEFKKICELDHIADCAGGFVDYHPTAKNGIHYDYRAIIAYCKQRGIEPIDMTIREMQQFIVA